MDPAKHSAVGPLLPADLQHALDQLPHHTFVRNVEWPLELGSTNDRARAWAVQPPELPLLIGTETQTAGRGRGSHRWWSAPGSLTFSLLLDPAAHGLAPTAPLSLAIGVAVIAAVRPYVASAIVGLHWPNDVYAIAPARGERKLAGMLIESLAGGPWVIGLGLNVNNSITAAPAELQQGAISLCDLAGRTVSRGEVLTAVLQQFERVIRQLAEEPAVIGQTFDALTLQHGRALEVRQGPHTLSGICRGIAPDGALLLDTASGPQAIYSGSLRAD